MVAEEEEEVGEGLEVRCGNGYECMIEIPSSFMTAECICNAQILVSCL